MTTSIPETLRLIEKLVPQRKSDVGVERVRASPLGDGVRQKTLRFSGLMCHDDVDLKNATILVQFTDFSKI